MVIAETSDRGAVPWRNGFGSGSKTNLYHEYVDDFGVCKFHPAQVIRPGSIVIENLALHCTHLPLDLTRPGLHIMHQGGSIRLCQV